MKKSLLVIMMSMVMGGLVATPKTAVTAKAEAEKLDRPDEVYRGEWNLTGTQGFHDDGALEYPWEYLQGVSYKDTGKNVDNFASLEIAFFPSGTTFNENEIYATVIHGHAEKMSSTSINSALKAVGAKSGEYSPALRYVSKDQEKYSNSDWYAKSDISHYYELDYKLNTYKSGENEWYVTSSGQLLWQWQILNNDNPEHDEIDHMDVLVFAGDTESIDDNSRPLTTFEVREGHGEIHKAEIEKYLTAANLKPGMYKFSARLIAKEESRYENSNLYPLTNAYKYEPEDLSLVNIAREAKAYASYGNASAAIDGDKNGGGRWINAESGHEGNDTGWLVIDLGSKQHLSTINIYWENAYAKNFDVYLVNSVNENNMGDTTGMTSIYSDRNRSEYINLDQIDATGKAGRYILISCFERRSEGWDFSIFEVEAYLNTEVTEVERFISDWKDLRALGNGDICNVKDSEKMARMLAWYDDLSDDDKLVLDTTDDAMGVSIGDTVRYLKAINGVADDATAGGSLSNMLLNTVTKDKTLAMAVVTFASIAVITVGYYFINKKKYNA